MGFVEILLISIGLAMDAFAASISKGICIKNITKKEVFMIAIFFGFFQFFMPILGYILGAQFLNIIKNFDYIIVFILLVGVGIKMIIESNSLSDIECCEIVKFSYKSIFILAIITSLDALAIGVSFSVTNQKLLFPAILIGLVTFLLSYAGVYIGRTFGNKYEKKAEIFGGVVLIVIGLKNFIEHFL